MRRGINWQHHVAQQPISGLSIKDYCLREDLNYQTFFAKRKELVGGRPASFAEVEIQGDPAHRQIHLQLNLGSNGRFELHGRLEDISLWHKVLGRAG